MFTLRLIALAILIHFVLQGCTNGDYFSSVRYPARMVIYINGSSCPSTWNFYQAGAGRMILGAGSGNFDTDTVELTPRTLGQTGGREQTNGIPATTLSATQANPGTTSVLASNPSVDLYGPDNGGVLDRARADGNMPPFYVLTACQGSYDSNTEIAEMIVAPFNSTCPTGWASFTNLNGRIVLAAGSGNTDAVGNALTARSVGLSSGREYTPGIPASTDPGVEFNPGPDFVIAQASALPYETTSSETTTLAGFGASANMPPFFVLNMCRTVGFDFSDVPSGMVLPFDFDSCPSGWSAFADAKGRMIVGSGSGGTDTEANPLTTRTLGGSGGRETTKGMFANTTQSSQTTTPASTAMFGFASQSIYRVGTANTSLAGPPEDSNLPPYITLLYCEKD